MPLHGEAQIWITFSRRMIPFKFRFLVSSQLGHDLIIGTDILSMLNGSISYRTRTLYVDASCTGSSTQRISLPLFSTVPSNPVNLIKTLSLADRPKLQFNSDLTDDQNDAIWNLLLHYPSVFSWSLEDIGKCKLFKYHIDTGDSPPIAVRFVRKSVKENEIIQNEVDKLLAAGIIRPSSSPWAANPLIVPKKKEPNQPLEYRMVVSYKKLNSVTVKDRFPMARIDDILYSLHGAKWFTKLDLFFGFLSDRN